MPKNGRKGGISMSDWKEFSAKTVEEALTNASVEFGTPSEKIEFEVLDKGSSGLIGLFSKQAKIKARVKDEQTVSDEIIEKSVSVATDAKVDEVKSSVNEVVDTPKTEKAEEVKEVADTPKITVSPDEAMAKAKKFLNDVFASMQISVNIDINFDEAENMINIDLSGDEMGILIGKRGGTLDSLQYLTGLVINKNSDAYIKVKVDTENYRERRKATLEGLAKNLASKVKRTHRPVFLEPMNPYERRIIHYTLQSDEYVETHSEGEEPYRKVVITPKPGMKYDGGRRNYRKYNGRGGRSYGGRKNYHKNDNYKKDYNKSENTDKED